MWISVEDKLPELIEHSERWKVSFPVLIWDDSRKIIAVATYCDYYLHNPNCRYQVFRLWPEPESDPHDDAEGVTHWMKLPNPPGE
jgi:hypothetical protein